MESIEKKVYEAIKQEYDKLNDLCKKIQDSYNNDILLELGHEDILPLLNVLDTFDNLI